MFSFNHVPILEDGRTAVKVAKCCTCSFGIMCLTVNGHAYRWGPDFWVDKITYFPTRIGRNLGEIYGWFHFLIFFSNPEKVFYSFMLNTRYKMWGICSSNQNKSRRMVHVGIQFQQCWRTFSLWPQKSSNSCKTNFFWERRPWFDWFFHGWIIFFLCFSQKIATSNVVLFRQKSFLGSSTRKDHWQKESLFHDYFFQISCKNFNFLTLFKVSVIGRNYEGQFGWVEAPLYANELKDVEFPPDFPIQSITRVLATGLLDNIFSMILKLMLIQSFFCKHRLQ